MPTLAVCYILDNNANRSSASISNTMLLGKSIRKFMPQVKHYVGVVGKVPSEYTLTNDVTWFRFECPDEEFRYSNKIEAMRVCPSEEDYLLFLDSDVLVCNTPTLDITGLVAGVHMDYPSEPTREGYARPVYSACKAEFPKTKIPCTMYGGDTYPIINTGVLYIHKSIRSKVTNKWLENFKICRKLVQLQKVKTYIEQLTIMPSLDGLGVKYQLLPVTYNWNGTIYKSPQDTVFLHYHRPDVLHSDPLAVKAIANLDS